MSGAPLRARSVRVSAPPPALLFALAGAAAISLYEVVRSPLGQAVLYDGLGAAAFGAFALRAARRRAERPASALLALGLALWVCGDVVGDVYRVGLGRDLPFPSPADPFYLLGYPLLAVGLLRLGRRLLGRQPLSTLIDAGIVGLAFALLTWVFVLDGQAERAGLTLLARVTLVAYPAMDVILLAVLVRLVPVSVRAGVPRQALLLFTGLVAQLAVDIGYAAEVLDRRADSWLDVGWMIVYACWGAAALVSEREERVRVAAPVPGSVRLLLLGAAAATGPSAVLGSGLHGGDAVVVTAFATVLALVVVARLAGLFVGLETLRRREQEAHDQADGARREAERARMELATQNDRLLASEARLRHLFEQAAIGIVFVDERRRLVGVNPAAQRMSGYSEEEFMQVGVDGITHPDDLELDRMPFAELLAGARRSYQVEKRYLRKDGGTVLGRVTYSLARDADGSPSFAIGFVEDVTRQREAEAAVRESEQELRAIIDNVLEAIVVLDDDRRLVRVNPAACRLLRVSEGALLGTRLDDVCRLSPEEMSALWRRFLTARTLESDLPLQLADGAQAAVEMAAVAGYVPQRHLAILRDVTAQRAEKELLRESEERWRTLLESLQEMVLVFDAQGRVTYASPPTEAWLGLTTAELQGTYGRMLVHPDDRARVVAALAVTVAGGSPVVVCRARHRDGTWRTIEARGSTRLEERLVAGVLVAVRDIEDRVELEAERERIEAERRLAQRLEAVGQLAAGVAHEINTPIQFVGDSVRFLEDADDDLLALLHRYRDLLFSDEPLDLAERQARILAAEDEADLPYLERRIPAAFERVFEGVERVTSIVRAMRTFAHPSDDGMLPADLNEALQTTLIVSRAEYKHVADVALDLGELPAVTCNVGDLNQVFLNLIVNAAQAIAECHVEAEERGTISIATRSLGDRVSIEIGDDGCGIPTDLRERVFDPFFTTKEVGRGTGQGLALARAIVERHRGSLAFETEEGRGTVFRIVLPVEADADLATRAA